jgi:YjjG family noncanonical pyrimidine nucleotidase
MAKSAERKSMKQYKCIFFDLDHTLWDYESNSRETLLDLFNHYQLTNYGVRDFESFHQQFKKVNADLWHLYDHGKITSEVIRTERFKQILEAFNAYQAELCQTLSYEYLHDCPKRGTLLPHAIEVLEYLSDKYRLTVVTNGFDEIQHMKLTSGKLHEYFDHIITSQKAGHKKPAREIFDFALVQNGVQSQDAIMVGDNLITDIAGAKNASVDTVFFNPDCIEHETEVSHEIQNLRELSVLL